MSEAKSESEHRRRACRAVVASPIPGVPTLAITTEQGQLCSIVFVSANSPATMLPDSSCTETATLLRRYFADGNTLIPLLQPHRGTPFQRRVWQALQQIPPGETRSYGELAKQLGSSARAVAGACRANPVPILIPCHRVVSASGSGGYMGQLDGPALEIKRWLLHHEGHV